MSFPDHIDHLFRTGKIQRQFRVADVEQHLRGTFAPNYIKTALANFAKDTGNYVERWSRPRFRRIAPGLYEVY